MIKTRLPTLFLSSLFFVNLQAVISFGCQKEVFQVIEFSKNRDGFKDLKEYASAESSVFFKMSSGELQSLALGRDVWIRIRSNWVLMKRKFVNEKSKVKRSLYAEYFLGQVQGNLLCEVPSDWQQFVRGATFRESDGRVEFEQPEKPNINAKCSTLEHDILVHPPQSFRNGMIECRDLEGRMVWQQELWHTNDMGGGTGLAHKHYYLSFSMNSKGDQVYLFGISSNYAYIRGYNVADGTSIGFVYLDHSGVIK